MYSLFLEKGSFLVWEIKCRTFFLTMNWCNITARFISSRMRLTWKMQRLNFRQYGQREQTKKAQCKKTVPENQKEIYSTFTFSTKATQNSLYYPEWTFRTMRYCSDRVVCQFSCVLEVRYCAILMSCLD